MKISVITACLNSQDTIRFALNSILTQTYKDIEHIIVDGGSKDATQELLKEYPYKNKKVFVKNNMKLYESLNFAIKKATGDYVIFLHSDDILDNKNTIKRIVNELKKFNSDIFFGNVIFFRKNQNKVVRYYRSKNLGKREIKVGLMPPHTGSVIRTNIYKKNLFNKDYFIAGDFDFFSRIFYKENFKMHYSKLLITRMKIGGVSTKNLFSYITSTNEIIKSLRENNIYKSFFLVFFRFLFKINQIFFFKKIKLNKQSKKNYHNFYKDSLTYDFFIYKSFKNILKKKKFILSAMNLAFLGSYVKNRQLKFPNLIHWPDGISAKIFNKSLIKIPGREILKKIQISKDLRRIVVIGNLSKKSKNVLHKLYNRKIINYTVPYGTSNFIFQKLKYKIKKYDLVFITLPTPKQEELAIQIAKNENYFKIICIGGSIAMISGEEKPVPHFLNNLEFIWRLRYETKRRFLRLIDTFLLVLLDFIFLKQIKSLKIKYKN